MDLLKDIKEEYSENLIPIVEAISSAVRELKIMKKGGKITDKMVKNFMKSNTNLVTSAALHALSANKQYKTNRRNTISFFAKDAYERRMITKMVQDLVKGKRFKIHRVKWAQGGKYWELKKLKSGF